MFIGLLSRFGALLGRWNRINLHHQKLYKGKHRHRAQKEFSRKKYRRRKLVERVMGNKAARDGSTLNYRRPDVQRKGLVLKYVAHNIPCCLDSKPGRNSCNQYKCPFKGRVQDSYD